jgi:hypothetical protein
VDIRPQEVDDRSGCAVLGVTSHDDCRIPRA